MNLPDISVRRPIFITMVTLIGFDPADPAWGEVGVPVRNPGGPLGAALAAPQLFLLPAIP